MNLLNVIIASILASGVNLCLRKNLEKQESAQGYLSLYFIFSLVISLCLKGINFESFSLVMSTTGIVVGILNFMMMVLLSRTLQIGPSGLTFAFQNSAAIFPSIVLFLIFGRAFGFNMTLLAVSGFSIMVSGLFLSVLKQKEGSSSAHRLLPWVGCAIAIFVLHGTILSLFQWRCLLLEDLPQSHVLIPWKCSAAEDAWFLPSFFLIPALLQTLIFGISERRWYSAREAALGIAGGLLNGGSTSFLLLATKHASDDEKIILFPLFAVSVIFICSLWGKFIYNERIYWPGLLLCLLGVFIGSL